MEQTESLNDAQSPPLKSGKMVRQICMMVIVIVVGLIATALLLKFTKKPIKIVSEKIAPLVTTQTFMHKDIDLIIYAHGTVRPKNQIEIISEVSGKITYVSPAMTSGEFFSKNNLLAKIDTSNYLVALKEAQAKVASAKVTLAIEESEAKIALLEWQKIYTEQTPSSPLLKREPQIEEAKANLALAQAAVDKAALDLKRTQIIAPFDGRVVSESIDNGKFIQSGTAIAFIYSTESVEIPCALEEKQLQWLTLPTMKAKDNGAAVSISIHFAGKKHQWQGQIKRVDAMIDPQSRMLHAIVEVNHPFTNTHNTMSLLPGLFVDLAISAKTLKNTFALPHACLKDDNTIWIVKQNKIEIKKIDPIWKDIQYVYIQSGINNGDKIITSALDIATNGMTIREQTVAGIRKGNSSDKQ